MGMFQEVAYSISGLGMLLWEWRIHFYVDWCTPQNLGGLVCLCMHHPLGMFLAPSLINKFCMNVHDMIVL